MKITVKILTGFGEIDFGMSMSVVRNKLSGEFRSFENDYNLDEEGRTYIMDAYDDQGIYCLYSPEGNIEAISLFPPARPVLDGVDIFTLRMGEAITLLKKMDPALAIDSDGAVSSRFSLGIKEAAEAEDDEDAFVENFFFGRAGYYD